MTRLFVFIGMTLLFFSRGLLCDDPGHLPERTNFHPAPTLPKLDCKHYQPGQSGMSPQEYWKIMALPQGNSVLSYEGTFNGWTPEQIQAWIKADAAFGTRADRELTPALLHLLSAQDTSIYYGAYDRNRKTANDGRQGQNVIFLKRMKNKEGEEVPVAAIASLEWDPDTFEVRFKTGPDAVRVRTAVRGKGDEVQKNSFGLSYEVDAKKTDRGTKLRIEPGKYLTGKILPGLVAELKPGVAYHAVSTYYCLSCHRAEDGWRPGTFRPNPIPKTPEDYRKHLSDYSTESFLKELRKAAEQKVGKEVAAQLVTKAEEKLIHPRTMIPKEWIQALEDHCQELAAKAQ